MAILESLTEAPTKVKEFSYVDLHAFRKHLPLFQYYFRCLIFRLPLQPFLAIYLFFCTVLMLVSPICNSHLGLTTHDRSFSRHFKKTANISLMKSTEINQVSSEQDRHIFPT